MNTHKTHTFTLHSPEQFEVQEENRIAVWLQDPTPQLPVQNPIVRVTLAHITSYNYIKKDTLKEQFFEANLGIRYKAETTQTSETEINGRTSYVQFAKTDDVFQNQPLQVSYYFVLMPVNEEYSIEMLCDVETKNWETYFPLFQEIFESIKFEGDLKKCHEAHDLYDAELTKSIKQNNIDFATEREKELQNWVDNHIQAVERTYENIFQIGENNFELTWDKKTYHKTQWGIGTNGQFYCDVVATINDAKRLQKKKILSEYNDKGELKVSFTYKGLYQSGLPKTEIQVKEGKIQSNEYFNFRFDGTHYNLVYFDGKIFIDEKGVKILGCLHDALDRKIPVNIQIAFAVADLDWKKYHFSTFEELRTAPDDLVEHINICKPPRVLPDEWQRFTNLKTLFLGYRYNDSEKGVTEIPTWINQLQTLESLNISSNDLTNVPNEVAELPELKNLSIFNSNITQLPDAVWQMQKLEYLSLANNQINVIPESIDLPLLKGLDLTYNQLKKLPKSIGDLPSLMTLSLERNPWQQLPETIERIPTLNLEIKYKHKFFNFEYQGADGKGIIQWNDMVYYAKNDSELLQSIVNYWLDETVQPYQEDLTALMKKALGFSLGEEDDYGTIGKHRIGGMPDFPKAMAYPHFGENWREGKIDYVYEFIAQINCADVAHLQDYLPRTGMLYFFLTTIHDVYENKKAAKVIYWNGDESELQSGKAFKFNQEDYFEAFDDIPYIGYQAIAETFVDIPDFYPIHQNDYVLEGLSQPFKDYLVNDRDSGYLLNELFEPYEKEIIAVNSYGFSQHEYPEHTVALMQKGNPKDWLILLKVPSVADFQWGDAGDLFFVIHKSDLAKQDFSNVICTMYSS